MKALIELYNEGVIDYLVSIGVVSTTILSYMHYYHDYIQLKDEGRTYRESVAILSQRYNVSDTTIKKGIRKVLKAQRNPMYISKRLAIN